jgi:hypothetical protein
MADQTCPDPSDPTDDACILSTLCKSFRSRAGAHTHALEQGTVRRSYFTAAAVVDSINARSSKNSYTHIRNQAHIEAVPYPRARLPTSTRPREGWWPPLLGPTLKHVWRAEERLAGAVLWSVPHISARWLLFGAKTATQRPGLTPSLPHCSSCDNPVSMFLHPPDDRVCAIP